MYAMGKLAIDLSNSVGEVLGTKDSCFFCQGRSLACKKNAVRLNFVLFALLSVAYVVFMAMFAHK